MRRAASEGNDKFKDWCCGDVVEWDKNRECWMGVWQCRWECGVAPGHTPASVGQRKKPEWKALRDCCPPNLEDMEQCDLAVAVEQGLLDLRVVRGMLVPDEVDGNKWSLREVRGDGRLISQACAAWPAPGLLNGAVQRDERAIAEGGGRVRLQPAPAFLRIAPENYKCTEGLAKTHASVEL